MPRPVLVRRINSLGVEPAPQTKAPLAFVFAKFRVLALVETKGVLAPRIPKVPAVEPKTPKFNGVSVSLLICNKAVCAVVDVDLIDCKTDALDDSTANFVPSNVSALPVVSALEDDA